MRLRDQLAAHAMQALLSRASIAELEITEGYKASECAQDAYIYADEMLRERKLKRKRAEDHARLEAIIAQKKVTLSKIEKVMK